MSPLRSSISCPAPPPRSGLAGWFRTAAVLALALMPSVMVVAHRSSLLVVTVAAALAAAAALADGSGPALVRALAGRLHTPLGITLLAGLAWALAAITWSPRPIAALRAYGEFGLALFAPLVLVAALAGRLPPRAPLWLAAGLLAAAALLLGDLWSGLALRRAAGLRAESFVLNRPALTLLVLLPVAVAMLVRSGRTGLAVTVAAVVALAVFRSDSGAARLGLVAAGAAGGLALLSRRLAAVLVGGGLLAALALAPVTGEIADRVLPPAVYDALAGAHARDRADIWTAFGAAIRQAPLVGHGFGSSAGLDLAPVAAAVDPAHRPALGVGHPHSTPVQIWTELGAVGAGLAGAALALATIRAASGAALDAAARLALLAAAGADMLVGQGAWQGWWPASVGAAIAWSVGRPATGQR